MKSPSKRVARIALYDRVVIAGVDVSDHVSSIDTHHQVGNLVTATVTFQGVRIEEEEGDDGPSTKHQVFHLVEREEK
jgi:hypothetical protein